MSRCAATARTRRARRAAVALVFATVGGAQAQLPALDALPRPPPPSETGPMLPSQVLRWRQDARSYEFGENGLARDPVRAAELYCRAARYGDAESQFSLAWMLTNSRGIERDEAQAAHLFAAAAEQGFEQAKNILARMGTPLGPPPACLRQPDEDALPPVPARAPSKRQPLPLPPNAPPTIVRFVDLVAPDYQLQAQLVLAFIATESNFDASAVSRRNAQGLMQLLPETAVRFGVRNLRDPVQNLRGGMAYLRWLMAYFQGDVVLVAAAYNAGEKAVERYLGVPPYAETRRYVLKIRAGLGGQEQHPYDPTVTPPSALLALMRPPGRAR